jgi:hypothetical protein
MRRYHLLLAPLLVTALLLRLSESKKPARGKSPSSSQNKPPRSSFSSFEEKRSSRRPSADDWHVPQREDADIPDILSDAEYYDDEEEYPADDDDDDDNMDPDDDGSGVRFDEDFKFEMPSFKSAMAGKGGEINDRLSSGAGKGALYDAYNQLHTLAQVRTRLSLALFLCNCAVQQCTALHWSSFVFSELDCCAVCFAY